MGIAKSMPLQILMMRNDWQDRSKVSWAEKSCFTLGPLSVVSGLMEAHGLSPVVCALVTRSKASQPHADSWLWEDNDAVDC